MLAVASECDDKEHSEKRQQRERADDDSRKRTMILRKTMHVSNTPTEIRTVETHRTLPLFASGMREPLMTTDENTVTLVCPWLVYVTVHTDVSVTVVSVYRCVSVVAECTVVVESVVAYIVAVRVVSTGKDTAVFESENVDESVGTAVGVVAGVHNDTNDEEDREAELEALLADEDCRLELDDE